MAVSCLGSRLRMYKHSTGCKLKSWAVFDLFYSLIESCCFAQNQDTKPDQSKCEMQVCPGPCGRPRSRQDVFCVPGGIAAVPHRGSGVSEAMEERSNLTWTGNTEEPRVPAAWIVSLEITSTEKEEGGEDFIYEVGFISWVIGSPGRVPVNPRSGQTAVWRRVQDQGWGGRCHFPDEMWVRVSTKMQAFTQSVDTHTEFSNWKFWCIL